jgi:hypothetical protein
MSASGIGTIVEECGSIDALRALVPHWESLAESAIEPNPFFEPWALLPALEAYGTQGFRCLAVWQDGVLGALFPLQEEKRFRGLPVRAMRSWRHRNMLLGTPLVREKSAARCIAAFLDTGIVPLVEFEWLPAGGPFYGALAGAATEGGHPWLVSDAYVRAVLLRERDPRPRYNSNMKNNLRRWEAKLRAAGSVTPARLEPGGDLARWTDEFLQLESKGWKGKAGSALACREDDRRFVAAMFPEAFRRGRLLMTGLDLDGKPLARHIMLCGGEGAYTFKIAYDETHAQGSPGIVGEVDNVRQFMENPGPRWIDSNTAAESRNYGRVWREWRTMQRIAVGLRGAGRVAVAALPLLRLAKRRAAGSRDTKES